MTMHNLQLEDLNIERGLQLRLAMGWYGDQTIAQAYPSHEMVDILEQAANYSVRHQLHPGNVSYVDPNHVSTARIRADARRRILLDDISAQLRSGKLYATGLRVGEHEPVTISRQWWNVGTLNPETNSAEGNGVTFSGLLIFETKRILEGGPDLTSAEGIDTPAATYATGSPGRPTPSNWDEFAPRTIRLADDVWTSDGMAVTSQPSSLVKVSPSRAIFHSALLDAVISKPIAPGSTTQAAWESECIRRGLLEPPAPEEDSKTKRARLMGFRAAKSHLLAAKWIGQDGDRVSDMVGKYDRF